MEEKRKRLAAVTGAKRKRKKVLGVERTEGNGAASAARSISHRESLAREAAAPRPGPPVAATIEGVGFAADGSLVDPKVWTRELALKIAAVEGVTLAPPHWKVVDFARTDFAATGASPNIRRLTQSTGLSTKELYALFPKAPARTTARIAGLPKPAGCI